MNWTTGSTLGRVTRTVREACSSADVAGVDVLQRLLSVILDSMSDQHDHGHEHDHEHGHEPGGRVARVWVRIRHAVRPHSHDSNVDAALESSAEGMRALRIGLLALGLTACAQVAVVALSGSVALLGDA